VLLAEMPGEYHQVLKRIDATTRSLLPLEMELIGCSHELVGAYLVGIWGLPTSILESVELHSCPSKSGKTEFSTLTATHSADAIASASDPSPLNHDVEMDTEHLRSLGLLDQEAVWQGFYREYLEAKAERGAGSSNLFS
jgi:HD-like signal output (HDOD) protein